MLTKPWPASAASLVEAGAVVGDLEGQLVDRRASTVTVIGAPSPAYLPAFCIASRQQKYTAASISASKRARSPMRQTWSAARPGWRPPRSASGRPGRAAAAGRCRGPARAARTSVACTSVRSSSSIGRRLRRVGRRQLAGEAELHRHRHQVLLGAVVQVALDLAAGLVGGGDDPGAGGVRARRCAAAARRGSPAAPSPGARCAGRARPGGRVGEHPVLLLVEGRSASPRSTTMKPSSSPEWAIGPPAPTPSPRPSVRAGTHTADQACPDTRRAGDDRCAPRRRG